MKIDFKKNNGLVPTIIQDASSKKILMLGYMNEASLKKTEQTGKVTFFSRSRQKLWTKGETSGNYLLTREILIDCDNDTLLIKAIPTGPVCHTGNDTCFDEINKNEEPFLYTLEKIIADRKLNPTKKSYTSSLFKKGINKIAQKVGEEATEVVIEAIDNNKNRLKEETADLLYHLLVLLQEKEISLKDINKILKERHN
ncbi:MAG: bifunctional phosphoribosyl-AMP cyclohydrolase/phosphoribosyl-ATP diphosphatase HisIE [Candidatus Marinimicrobia bacterium]|nr:bifunctional phosphoribosyl-AMP cyclohydrolase/phosphoribosyl-ATP diphosphatase HisIE [Candidatus Neomarinimicrobiota bacterium]